MNSGRDKRVPGERNFWIITGIPQQDDLWDAAAANNPIHGHIDVTGPGEYSTL
jgi:hypothetical protein